jgi:hypothetical protein
VKGHPIAYTPEQRAWLEANCTMVIGEYHRAFCDLFGRADVSAQNIHALRKREGWSTGRSGRFEKGAAPVNKGKKCAPGTGGLHPNARRTHFKKGERTGVAVDLYKPIGTERWSQDGYLERKVNDDLPAHKRWRLVHLVRWEAKHGAVPNGMALKSIDGNRSNTDPSNWELIPRSLLPRINGGRATTTIAYDAAPAALKPTVLAAAKLADAAARVRKPRIK